LIYLCEVKHAFDGHKKGDRITLSPFDLSMWKKFVRILKRIREKPITVYK